MSVPRRVVILGATSAIAEATARLYAREHAALLLAGRNGPRLEEIAGDLRTRGARAVETYTLDFVTAEAHPHLAKMIEMLGGVDDILLAWGVLGDQRAAEQDEKVTTHLIDTNFTAAARWALAAAEVLEKAGRGALIALGSVAGDRGRRRNYVYGAAKAGLATLMEGIAHRFAGKGPRAVVVKAGPTDTPMTAGMAKGGLLWSSPDTVAALVRRAADAGGPVQYAPRRWRVIMAVVRALPFWVFSRTNF